jgi:hypothetical protein
MNHIFWHSISNRSHITISPKEIAIYCNSEILSFFLSATLKPITINCIDQCLTSLNLKKCGQQTAHIVTIELLIFY